MYRCHSGVHALFQNFSEAGLWLVFPFCCLDSSSCAVSLKFLSHHLLDFIPLDFDTLIVPKEVSVCECAIWTIVHCVLKKLVNYNLVNRN